MSGERLAFQKYTQVMVSRARQFTEMRERLAELGDDRGLQQLNTMMTQFAATGPQFAGDPFNEFLTDLARVTKNALADLGASRATLDDVWTVALNHDAFSARMTRFIDDSGLVAVSDATNSLCVLYAQTLALAEQRGPEPQVLTGLLRYYNTQQRVFRKSGKLEIRLDRAAMQHAGLLTYLATQFVLSHELAHYVLGHPSSVSAFAPDEYLPVCSESHQLEAEADLHALRTVRHVCKHFVDELPPGGGDPALGAVGAAIGTLVVHVTERALFVRRGASHPPARQRAAALLREMNAQERGHAQEVFDLTLAVTEASSHSGPGAGRFTPGMFGSAPIYTPLDPSSMRTIEVFDEVQCASTEWYLNLLTQASRESGESWLANGAQLAADGDAAAALRIWGVPKANIGAMCDPEQPLTFNALYMKLLAPFTARGIPADRQKAYAIAAAKLVGEPLSGESSQTGPSLAVWTEGAE